MDASVYSTDYLQVSQQLSLQSQRQIKVEVQNSLCAQIPRSLSSVPGKEMIKNKKIKILFPQSRTSSKRVLLEDYRLSTGQSLASILPYASLVKNI